LLSVHGFEHTVGIDLVNVVTIDIQENAPLLAFIDLATKLVALDTDFPRPCSPVFAFSISARSSFVGEVY
jgi:hypothetical protein